MDSTGGVAVAREAFNFSTPMEIMLSDFERHPLNVAPSGLPSLYFASPSQRKMAASSQGSGTDLSLVICIRTIQETPW